jgi:MYXO-CTERM domain-containing protein
MLRRAIALGTFVSIAALATTSEAHFILQAPTSWLVQDTAGLPEKLGPCGDEYDNTSSAVASNVVTAYQVGDTITITINEVIFHPGHYRISLGDPDRDALPPEPAVTPGTNTPCGTAAIESTPVYPVLADNVFPHTAPFSTPQTTTVKLPSNVTCAKCTLQVIEFMSEHPLNNPGGCFYHHCANISIGVADSGTPPSDAGTGNDAATSNPDASTPGGENETTQGGCGCSVPGAASLSGLVFAGLAFAALLARRRRA